MRGFRGSRSVQNSLASRFGDRRDQRFRDGSGVGGGAGSFDRFGSNASRAPLPDWLKTPETREAERHAHANAQKPVASVRLVVDNTAAAAKAVAAKREAVAEKREPTARKRAPAVRAAAPRRKLVSARKRASATPASRGGAGPGKSAPARSPRRKAA